MQQHGALPLQCAQYVHAMSTLVELWIVVSVLVLTGEAYAQPAPIESTTAKPAEPEPWRVGTAIGAPSWLELGIEQQSRFEHLANDYRANADSSADALSLRTLIAAEGMTGSFFGGLELEDSRTYASDATPLNTTHVDTLELLQAYVGVRRAGALTAGDNLEAKAGRITIDLSTRRLVARNKFRNTVNGFTGVDAKWTSPGKHVARAFVAVPVTRLPSEADAVKDNDIDPDEENTDSIVWSAYYGSPALIGKTQLEAYAIGVHERDGEIASRNRQLLTFGVRWFRKPAKGRVDFDLEILPQIGKARESAAMDDVEDLDHRAWSSHAEIGISPALAWKLRLSLQHDYASGDHEPDDGSTERFDPLFGARRFDFGPTGVYGPFARSNIHSPGVRVAVAPNKKLDAFASYRLFWLASSKDAWVTAGVRDTMGMSGTFLGQHVEVQLRWSPLPKNLSVEGGAAYLRRGEFAKTAPDTRTEAATYVYTQVTINL